MKICDRYDVVIRRTDGDSPKIHTWGHDIAHLQSSQPDDILQHPLFIRFDDSLSSRQFQQGAELALIEIDRSLARSGQATKRRDDEHVKQNSYRADQTMNR